MSAERVSLEKATPEALMKYWDILSTVFDEVDPKKLRQGMAYFGPDTLFFSVEIDSVYLSVMFVTPVTIAGTLFGGIGGVCTRPEYRGRGYGRLLFERVLEETSPAFRVLLLWTRIPGYFSRFGFVEMPELFALEPAGSSPMLFFQDENSRSTISALRGLPRVYF